MSNGQRAGNVLIDFLTTGMIAGSVMVGILLIGFLSTAHLLQKTELYFLARSRLYQNNNDCTPQPGLWPEFASLEISYACSEGSKIISELKFDGKEFFRQSVDLEGKN